VVIDERPVIRPEPGNHPKLPEERIGDFALSQKDLHGVRGMIDKTRWSPA
jgi:hypothetical protein